ncbi:MAG: hypothetical protein RH859_07650 [Longimicrobiales bacterium]
MLNWTPATESAAHPLATTDLLPAEAAPTRREATEQLVAWFDDIWAGDVA